MRDCGKPRVFVPIPSEALLYIGSIMEAGGEPMVFGLPMERPFGGVALRREWVADWAETFCANNKLDALLLSAEEPAELAGLLIAALRLDLPVAVVPVRDPFAIALAALGGTPIAEDAATIAVELGKTGRPRLRELVEGFSLANALRAGLASGAGPELLVHLAAIAREAGVIGFPQMIRVLAPESPKAVDLGSSWFDTYGTAGLLSHLGDALHDTRTVTGRLKEALPPAPPALEDQEAAGSRLAFVRGRASGTEVVCRTDSGVAEVSGHCRFFGLEEDAVRAVEGGGIERSELLVVAGCGPGGGPGLIRLDRLSGALDVAGLAVPVLTDGLPPDDATGAWASLMTPDAAAGGVIARLRDGDFLRIDLEKGLIRTGAAAEEIRRREPFASPVLSTYGYAARYARYALPALEGAGFR
ncbi:MAG: Dihydroxy-acid dehydratase [uncultured Rubrobacteraceae bacterium]|uniref:Dihydroxy-acid dehydratase n=1 Tax=uncultured Rubrobacteraceae bacterium TaxID=349277 RepID=A0A6J4Q8R5_9ACTN|nr:MAG: Dihydroxy-acid dehydratase [uncultured Rubrobacteraceae bacterium]